MTVLFLFSVRPALADYLRSQLADRSDVRLLFPDDVGEVSLLALAPEATVMVGWRPTTELLAAASRLKLFINPGAGVQHLLSAFRRLAASRAARGLAPTALANGHGNTGFAAQHAVALLLALTNRVAQHHAWMATGQWRKGDAEAASIPLGGRHVGLLGYGAIGRHVHQMLSGFDLRFSALRRDWSREGKEDVPEGLSPAADLPFAVGRPPTALERYEPGDLPAFLAAVDTLVVAVPQTAETAGLLGAAELALLGPRGLLVNVARGPVIDEAALYAALSGGLIAGAAIDVWYDYDPPADADGRRYPYHHPFHTLPTVVLSPHRAASPMDDLGRWDEVLDNIRRVADGRSDLRNVVDLERGY